MVEGATYFSNSNGEVLDEKLAKVVEGVELTGLQYQQRGRVWWVGGWHSTFKAFTL